MLTQILHSAPGILRRRRTIVLALTLATSFAAASAAREITSAQALEALKGLAGNWHGTTQSGASITIDYRIAAHGSTLIETQSPVTDEEMITVYSIAGGDLVLTHYCPMGEHGNQPHMMLDRTASQAGDLRFSFVSLANMDPAKDIHVHTGRLVILDADHLRREWVLYKDGKPAATLSYQLARVGR